MRCIRTVKALRAREGSTCAGARALHRRRSRRAVRAPRRRARSRSPAPARRGRGLSRPRRPARGAARGGADAVWPGWGFVAEDRRVRRARRRARASASSARRPTAMRALGDKIGAKRVAEQAGVPVLPWSGGERRRRRGGARARGARSATRSCSKATRGRRRPRHPRRRARRQTSPRRSARRSAEARAAFGDDRAVPRAAAARRPPHRGADRRRRARQRAARSAAATARCSAATRRCIEEAPPPGLDPRAAARRSMDAARAARAARRLRRRRHGRVPGQRRQRFRFLEMNPRLQVEHGITEELTGTRPRRAPDPHRARRGARRAAAARARLRDRGARVRRGSRGRLPAGARAGSRASIPRSARGVRDRHAASRPAATCRRDFDSLIAKVIATGDTREEARARLAAALADFELVIEGGATNKGYLLELLDDASDFRARRRRHRAGSTASPRCAPGATAYAVARAGAPPRSSPTSARRDQRAPQLLRRPERTLAPSSRAAPRRASASISRTAASRIACTSTRSAPGATACTSTGRVVRRDAARARARTAARLADRRAARCACSTTSTRPGPARRGRGPPVPLLTGRPRARCARARPRWWSRSHVQPGDRVEAGAAARPASKR